MTTRTQCLRAFTLVELLIVAALVAALVVGLARGLQPTNATAALRAAQATVYNLLVAGRSTAMASGQNTRVLVQVDPTSPLASARYLRCWALQRLDPAGWTTLAMVSLPAGTYVVPRDPTSVDGLVIDPIAWTRPSDGGALRSTALRMSDEVMASMGGEVEERWAAICFSPRGTTISSQALVLVAGERTQGHVSPVRLAHPERVRGLVLSVYGVPALVDGRSGF